MSFEPKMSPDAFSRAETCVRKCVWRLGSAQTHWGSLLLRNLSASPDPLAAMEGPTFKGKGERGEEVCSSKNSFKSPAQKGL